MEINTSVLIKNLQTITNAYGIKFQSKASLEKMEPFFPHVKIMGISLRDITTRQKMLSFQFPFGKDITNDIILVPVSGALFPALTFQVDDQKAENIGFLKECKTENNSSYTRIFSRNQFSVTVYNSLRVTAPILNYDPDSACGRIKRRSDNIHFTKTWCNFDNIDPGKEVSFISVVTRNGLQARGIKDLQPHSFSTMAN